MGHSLWLISIESIQILKKTHVHECTLERFWSSSVISMKSTSRTEEIKEHQIIHTQRDRQTERERERQRDRQTEREIRSENWYIFNS